MRDLYLGTWSVGNIMCSKVGCSVVGDMNNSAECEIKEPSSISIRSRYIHFGKHPWGRYESITSPSSYGLINRRNYTLYYSLP